MTGTQQEDLLEIRLNKEGAASLLRNYKLTRWLLITGMAVSFFGVVNLVFGQILSSRVRFVNKDSFLRILQTILYPVTGILDFVLFILQLYFFFRFNTVVKKSIQNIDEALFNQSFQLLNRYTKIACLQLCMLLIIYAMSFYVEIVTYTR